MKIRLPIGRVGINSFWPVEFVGEGVLDIKALVPIARDGGCYYADGAYCKSLADILMAHMRDEEWWREAAMSSEVIISPTVVERGSEDITMGRTRATKNYLLVWNARRHRREMGKKESVTRYGQQGRLLV